MAVYESTEPASDVNPSMSSPAINIDEAENVSSTKDEDKIASEKATDEEMIALAKNMARYQHRRRSSFRGM